MCHYLLSLVVMVALVAAGKGTIVAIEADLALLLPSLSKALNHPLSV